MKILVLAVLALVLVGCATASRLSDLSPGMTKDQVAEKMGSPDAAWTDEDKEILAYKLHPTASDSWTENYGVVLKDGKLIRYGHMDQLYPPSQSEIAARQQRAMMGMQMLQNMQRAPTFQNTFTPVQPYQVKTPAQTNCTTSFVGGTGYTNCRQY